jgi:hypothetical protein
LAVVSQGYVRVTVTGLVKAFDRTPDAPVVSEVLEHEVPEYVVPLITVEKVRLAGLRVGAAAST